MLISEYAYHGGKIFYTSHDLDGVLEFQSFDITFHNIYIIYTPIIYVHIYTNYIFCFTY